MKIVNIHEYLKTISNILIITFFLFISCLNDDNETKISYNNDIKIINNKIYRMDGSLIDTKKDIRHTGHWYKGDLHMHSKFRGNEQFPHGSKMDNGDKTVGEMLKIVKNKGFDYVSITDHDFLPDFMMFHPLVNEEAYPPHWTDPEYHDDDMVLLYGIEYTTIGGHANIWYDKIYNYSGIWKTHNFLIKNYKSLFLNFLITFPLWDDAVEEAHLQGALFSINHPSEGWISKKPEKFDTMEIWNAPFYLVDRFNRNSVNNIWQKYLSQGRRLSGVGGSDKHRFNNTKNFDVGQPTTWIFSRKKNGKSILGALKAGHVSISYTSEAGYLEFVADADINGNADVMEGDNITTDSTKEIEFTFRYVEPNSSDIEGEVVEISSDTINSIGDGLYALDEYINARKDINSKILCLYKNGKRYKAWILKNNCNITRFSETIEENKKIYYRLELFGKTNWAPYQRIIGGRIIGLTNPIYINY